MRTLSIHRDLRKLFATLLAIALAQSLIVVVPAWAVQHLFDRFTARPDSSSLATGTLVALFSATALAAFLLEVGKRRLASEIGLRHAANLRNSLFRRMIEDPELRARKADKGTLLLPFVGDLTASRRWFGEGLARGSAALVLIPVLLGLIAIRSGAIAAGLGAALALTFLCSLALSPPLDRAVREVRRHRGELTGFIAGRLEAAATIKVSGRTRRELRKVATRTDKLSQAERRRAWFIGLMRGLAHLNHSILVLVTLLIGSRAVASGGSSPGAIVGILSLVGLLSAGTTDLSRAFEVWHPARIAEERINRVLRAKPRRRAAARQHSKPIGSNPGDLVLSRLAVSRRSEAISATVSPGERITIEGSPGQGKSALIGVIAQLVEPIAGTVRLGPVDLASLSESERRRLIGFGSNDCAILPGSLAMNIAYRGTVTDQQAAAALATRCGLDSLVARLRGGMKGRLTRDTPMSDAERHGIFLARALYGEPALVLLDSIDSELPEATLQWLSGYLGAYPGVVVLVAENDDLRALASRRWTLENGVLHDQPVAPRATLPAADDTVVPFGRSGS